MKRMYKISLVAAIAAAGVALLSGCGNSEVNSPDTTGEETPTLYFSAIPDQDSMALKEKYDKVAAYLSEQLSVPVVFKPSKDYGASVEEFTNGNIQLAWFGGLTGVQARHLVPGARAIIQGVEDPDFYSYFIAHKDTGLTQSDEFPTEIAKLPFAFGSEKSTSGRLMPQHFLETATGKSMEEFFGENRPLFSGSHDLTYEWVKAGKVKAGVLNYKVYGAQSEKNPDDDVVIIWKTPFYADYNFTAHPSLEEKFGAGFTDKLQQVLVDMDDPDLLKSFSRADLIPAKNEEFDGIKAVAEDSASSNKERCIETVFQLERAAVSYGTVAALRPSSVVIGAGERVALVGPSGAGKSTLLHALNGTVKPDADGGEVCAFGTSFSQLSSAEVKAVRARIGFVHQRLDLVPNIRVIQNVVYGRLGQLGLLKSLRMTLHPSAAICDEVYALLERVGIPDKMYHRTDQLSGGQQQRVAIARALFQRPEAILADEPVSSVDPARARDVVALLTRLCEEESLTLVTSIHNLELAQEYFPRLIGLRNGSIQFDKPTEDVTPTEFTALYDLDHADMLEDG